MERDRRGDDYDPDVTHLGRGESYRPGGGGGAPPYRPGPARDRAAGDKWTSDRRELDRREDVDSYVPQSSRRPDRPRSRSPAGYRRRSRSPITRGRDGGYPTRQRSPLRRFSPRRGERLVSPSRRRSRSPYGGRPFSPPMKRTRDLSPSYPRRSPPAKRERLSSPARRRYDRPRSPHRRPYSPPPRDVGPRGYRTRSRTPPRRDERRNAYKDDNWRRRSPSPRAAAPSAPASGATSRRSSPPIHPDRVGLAGSRPRSPAYPPSRSYDTRPPRSPVLRPRSPPERERSPSRPRSPSRSYVDRTRAPPSPRDDHRRSDEAPSSNQPPSGPVAYRNGNYNRPPPSGPSQRYGETSNMSPPVGPSGSSVSMSAHNRPNPAIFSAPTRPRGAPPGRFDGPPRDFSAPPPRRGGYGGPPPRSAGYDARDGPHPVPKGGFGRGGFGRGEAGYGRGDPGHGRGESGYGRVDSSHASHGPNFGNEDGHPKFRSHNNSSSRTYPLTQRFNQPSHHLARVEKIIPGGKLAPSGMSSARIKQLELAAEKMWKEIEEKEKDKRKRLRELEVCQRESEREGLRSELAERHLEKLTEREDGAGAVF